MFDAQYQISKSKGLWLNSYAGSNPNEYFAELTMWYFGTHGDLNMTGPKPEDGPEGLKKYDPDAYKLLDDFYTGKIEIAQVEPRPRPGTNGAARRTPRDSQAARAIVNLSKLTRAALYVSALTTEDWRENCDRSRTDRAVHLRSGTWYRRRLNKFFRYVGFGIWVRKDVMAMLWEMERPGA